MGKSRVILLESIVIKNIKLGLVVNNECSEDDVQYWQDIFDDLNAVYREISSPMPVGTERIDIIQGNISNVIPRIRDMIGPRTCVDQFLAGGSLSLSLSRYHDCRN